MAEWPDADDLKQYVDVEGTEDWNFELESAMDAGIERVKSDVGGRDEDGDLNWDGEYLGYLRGHRREFGIA